MKVRKIFKISAIILLGILLVLSALVAIFYYQYEGKYSVNSKKYTHHVGYIAPKDKIQSSDKFSLCGKGGLIGYYSSSAPKIYRGSKKKFREFILSNFQNRKYEDEGYLNLRFHISCRGEVGNLAVNELNNELEKTDLSDDLVAQLIGLVSRTENWEPFAGEELNYYMYLNFKIENGNITEIIP